MMNSWIKQYDLEIEADFSEYLSIWRSGASRRPHDHPQYMRLMRGNNQSPHALVYFEELQAKIIYPFYIITLDEFEALRVVGGCKKHMVSAYGYGGPVLLNLDSVDFIVFEELLDKYISENHIISEFVREDLFSEFKPTRRFESIKQQDNVVVNLDRTHEELWSSYKHSVRKNIKRAESSNLEVFFDFDGQMTEEFVRVYHLTMSRANANQLFMITLSAFEELNAYLHEDKIGFYIHVLLDGVVIATELILSSPKNLYSFLGGSDMQYSHLRPSDLLKHKVNTWAIDNGISRYVLGGGVKPYDGIYNFKLAFDQEGAHSFCIQRNIHNISSYRELVSAKKLDALQHDESWEPNPDFFPAYLS
jgi:hypothetical protein